MVTEQSSSGEPKPKQDRAEVSKLLRNEWNALTPKEKKTRVRAAIKKVKEQNN
jgi:hypothetical protein|tara:strand:+ start:321 stop:479 length:159 start_codon:yes stop_codon:yes gene_type:complete